MLFPKSKNESPLRSQRHGLPFYYRGKFVRGNPRVRGERGARFPDSKTGVRGSLEEMTPLNF